jgi:hypothetical protein
MELYTRFTLGESDFNFLMRRIICRAIACKFGHGVHIGSSVGFKHLETFEIGNQVFIGSQTYLQGGLMVSASSVIMFGLDHRVILMLGT